MAIRGIVRDLGNYRKAVEAAKEENKPRPKFDFVMSIIRIGEDLGLGALVYFGVESL